MATYFVQDSMQNIGQAVSRNADFLNGLTYTLTDLADSFE